MSHLLYLALGSNLGERRKNLCSALDRLAPAIRLVRVSSVYETAPWGYADQPAFLNQVASATTALTPQEVLQSLQSIEAALGRKSTFRYGPRLIDLDLLFYDDLTLNEPSLQIPHPRLAERAFVLVPLAEIAPEFHHPITGKTVLEMLQAVSRQGVEVYTEQYE